MKTLTKKLAPLVMLFSLFAIPAKSQDLVINQASQLQDTIPLGTQISISWQIANAGSDSLDASNGIDVKLKVGNDSVNGVAIPFTGKLQPNGVFPPSNQINQLALTEVLDINEYSEGSKQVCLITTNKTGQNQGRDTFCQTVYFNDVKLDLGVTKILPPDNNEVFRDSLVTTELIVENKGSDTLRDSTGFPVRTIVENPNNNGILDTLNITADFDNPLYPGDKDTVSTLLFVSPNTEPGSYTYKAQTRLANRPLMADPDSTNDAAPPVTLDVKRKYNVKPMFTGLNDGDTITRGSRVSYGINLLNEGPGTIRPRTIQTRQGEQPFPFIIDKANFAIDQNYDPSSELTNVPYNSTIGVNVDSPLLDGLSFRVNANSNDDSLELSFYHESRAPANSLFRNFRQIAFANTRDTNNITVYIKDENFDIGISNINPTGDIGIDSMNTFEVTIKNFSNNPVAASNQIPTSVFIKDIDFSNGKLIDLSSEIPANGSVTETINIDLRQASEGQYELGMETQWDASRFGIDNNPANDTATVEIDTEKVDGIANNSMVSEVGVYPNPVDDNARLTYNLVESQQVTVTLQNMKGQQLQVIEQGRQASGEQTLNFNVGNLDAGTYVYNIQTEEGETTGRLVVK